MKNYIFNILKGLLEKKLIKNRRLKKVTGL